MLGMGQFLGHGHDGKIRAWKKGQWPSAEDCQLLEQKLGFSLRWLVTGEGEPFAQDSQPPALPAKSQSVPMRGFAACSLFGWAGCMTLPTPITAPHLREGMICVMATGESMLPEGIGHGHICWCDPHAEPVPGECVYVEQKDGHHTLKTFLGRGAGVGANTKDDQIALRGWMDKDKDGAQVEIVITVFDSYVKTIAPVIYVQRRL